MAPIQSYLELSLEEDREAATVGGREDKLSVEGTITAVLVLLNTTTTIMVDTTTG